MVRRTLNFSSSFSGTSHNVPTRTPGSSLDWISCQIRPGVTPISLAASFVVRRRSFFASSTVSMPSFYSWHEYLTIKNGRCQKALRAGSPPAVTEPGTCRAEGTGLEPATPFGAPHLQCGCSPIRIPSKRLDECVHIFDTGVSRKRRLPAGPTSSDTDTSITFLIIRIKPDLVSAISGQESFPDATGLPRPIF